MSVFDSLCSSSYLWLLYELRQRCLRSEDDEMFFELDL